MRAASQRLAKRHKAVKTGTTLDAAVAAARCVQPIRSREREGGSRVGSRHLKVPIRFSVGGTCLFVLGINGNARARISKTAMVQAGQNSQLSAMAVAV